MPNPDYHRRSIRLPGYDYRQAGAYFITIVAYQREPLFAYRSGQQIELNALGQVVASFWINLPKIFPIELDEWIIMPDHFHAILLLYETHIPENLTSPDVRMGPETGSLGSVIQYFKSFTTRRINKIRRTPNQLVWQRNYYEHILRNNEDLAATRRYIQENPFREDEDF